MARTAALSVAVRLSADAVALCLRGFALLPSASFGQTSDRRHRGCPGMCHYARALARGCGLEPAAWVGLQPGRQQHCARSEEHTSALQSLMRHSYAVFCLKKKTNN